MKQAQGRARAVKSGGSWVYLHSSAQSGSTVAAVRHQSEATGGKLTRSGYCMQKQKHVPATRLGHVDFKVKHI